MTIFALFMASLCGTVLWIMASVHMGIWLSNHGVPGDELSIALVLLFGVPLIAACAALYMGVGT